MSSVGIKKKIILVPKKPYNTDKIEPNYFSSDILGNGYLGATNIDSIISLSPKEIAEQNRQISRWNNQADLWKKKIDGRYWSAMGLEISKRVITDGQVRGKYNFSGFIDGASGDALIETQERRGGLSTNPKPPIDKPISDYSDFLASLASLSSKDRKRFETALKASTQVSGATDKAVN
tara:strand:+ start:11576 stop:12109 length:534 start_codon:yes stop_codon:yes gene_type:complete